MRDPASRAPHLRRSIDAVMGSVYVLRGALYNSVDLHCCIDADPGAGDGPGDIKGVHHDRVDDRDGCDNWRAVGIDLMSRA